MTYKKLMKLLDDKKIEFIINGMLPDIWVLQFSRKDFDSMLKINFPFIKESGSKSEVYTKIDELIAKLKVKKGDTLILTKQNIRFLLVCRD